MKSDVTSLPENKVKVSIEVDEDTFEGAIDQAFKKIGREVTIPGFRRGKVPRRVLEARIGRQSARFEALNDALPGYYAEAVRAHQVDVIAAPEFDLTGGTEDGPVCFDAVVEVRPQVEVEGYADLEVEVPSPVAAPDEVEAELTRLRRQFAELRDVERPAADGDHVTIDIVGSVDGEPLPGLTADDYLYEVGQGAVTPELDDHLRGASDGDVLEFDAAHPVQEDTRIDFRIAVKGVQEQVLPELTDEWADANTEFDTADAVMQSFDRPHRPLQAVPGQHGAERPPHDGRGRPRRRGPRGDGGGRDAGASPPVRPPAAGPRRQRRAVLRRERPQRVPGHAAGDGRGRRSVRPGAAGDRRRRGPDRRGRRPRRPRSTASPVRPASRRTWCGAGSTTPTGPWAFGPRS